MLRRFFIACTAIFLIACGGGGDDVCSGKDGMPKQQEGVELQEAELGNITIWNNNRR